MHQPSLKKVAILAVICVLAWLTGRYLLPILLPFLLAFLLALVSEPVVRVLRNRLHLPRWTASGMGVTLSLLVTVLALLTVCAFLLRQLRQLTAVIPDLEGTARQGMASLQGFLLNAADSAPEGIRPLLTKSVDGLFSDGSALLESASGSVLRLASGVVTRIPDSALGVGTFLIASFMISGRLPQLRGKLSALLPQSWHRQYLPALARLRKALSGWVLAQLKLAGVTFGVLCGAFLLLKIPYGPLWAALISLLDALPVLGTGTVLVPWSLVCFLQGSHARAVGLLGAYVAAAVLRSVLEPKLIGKQLGMDPLVTLLALYAGFRLWGLAGMIFAPLLAVAVTQLMNARKEQ